MRPSPHRHTLAVLRTFLGLTQKEMAALLGCSQPTIQAIELGKLRLSDKLANQIRYETGIGLGWLLGGDPSAPPMGSFNTPYTRDTFDFYQACKNRRTADSSDFSHVRDTLSSALIEIQTLLLESYEQNKLDLCSYKLRFALKQLRKELGIKETRKFHFGHPEDFEDPKRLRHPRYRSLAPELKELAAEFEKHFQKLYDQKPKPQT